MEYRIFSKDFVKRIEKLNREKKDDFVSIVSGTTTN